MFMFGAKSLANLVGVHPDLVRVIQRALRISDMDFSVQEGLRTLEQQTLYVQHGTSKTMDSKHLKQPDGFGHAVDLVPFMGGQPRWEWPVIYPVADAMHQAAIAETVRLRWGGVWDRVLNDLPGGAAELKAAVASYCTRHPGPDFLDGPHYELVI